MTTKKARGFTLIEVLVVIGIIAILAAVVLIAINPARQFAQARDSQRTSNVNAILNAVGQYIADNRGDLTGLDLPAQGATADISAAGSDLCSDLLGTYLPSIPVDPGTDPDGAGALAVGTALATCVAGYDTGYTIGRDANDRLTVSAVGQITNPISVTR